MDKFYEVAYKQGNDNLVARVYAETVDEAYEKFKQSDEEGEIETIDSEPPYHSIYHATID